MAAFCWGLAAGAEFLVGALWMAYGGWPALGLCHWGLGVAFLGLAASS